MSHEGFGERHGRYDMHHAAFRTLFADPPALVTTPLVIAEAHGWFLRGSDRTIALRLRARAVNERGPRRSGALASGAVR